MLERKDHREGATDAIEFASEVLQTTGKDESVVYGLQTKAQRDAAAAAAAAASLSSGTGPGGKEERSRAPAAPPVAKRRLLSFEEDEDEDSEGGTGGGGLGVSFSMSKDPSAASFFLRDASKEEEKRRLEAEWEEQQERVKKEKVEVTYSFWDGSGHRRTMDVPKGATVGQFLAWAREDLSGEFPELLAAGDDLIFVKEDLILPHSTTFYDLIVTKARGRSGPLFDFSSRETVVVSGADAKAASERGDAHPGKVVLSSWFEKNRHVFPASRWKAYEPGDGPPE